MVKISLEVFGEAAISRELLRFSERALDASPAFEVIADMFYDSEKKQFASQGDYASSGWAPLTATYAAWKNKKYPGKTILELTGALYDSLTGPDSDEGTKTVTPDTLTIESSDRSGPFHQFGTNKMPMRKPVELPEGVKIDMVKVLQSWLVHGGKL
jgi:hypothetical protein